MISSYLRRHFRFTIDIAEKAKKSVEFKKTRTYARGYPYCPVSFPSNLHPLVPCLVPSHQSFRSNTHRPLARQTTISACPPPPSHRLSPNTGRGREAFAAHHCAFCGSPVRLCGPPVRLYGPPMRLCGAGLTCAGFAVGAQLEVGRAYAHDGVAQLIGGRAQVRASAAHDGRHHVHGAGPVMVARVHGPVEHVPVVGQIRPAALAVRLAVAPRAAALNANKKKKNVSRQHRG